MRGYEAKQEPPTAGGTEQSGNAARVKAEMPKREGTTTANLKTKSLLQMREALDRSPRIQSQIALQRALDRSAAAKPRAPEPKRKPPLQAKRVGMYDGVLQRLELNQTEAQVEITWACLIQGAGDWARPIVEREITERADGWISGIQQFAFSERYNEVDHVFNIQVDYQDDAGRLWGEPNPQANITLCMVTVPYG